MATVSGYSHELVTKRIVNIDIILIKNSDFNVSISYQYRTKDIDTNSIAVFTSGSDKNLLHFEISDWLI